MSDQDPSAAVGDQQATAGVDDQQPPEDGLTGLLNRFAALSPVKQAAIVGVTAWNVWLIVLAQRSLNRTPAEQLRGPKWLWRLACLTNTVGPLVYFRWGRREPEAQ